MQEITTIVAKQKNDGYDATVSPEQNIHAFKIDKRKMMNISDFAKKQSDYTSELRDIMSNNPPGSRQHKKASLLYVLASDESSFAMMMGIDGVYMPYEMYGEPPHFAIYNRTAIKTTRLNYLMDYHSVNDLNNLSKFSFGDGLWK